MKALKYTLAIAGSVVSGEIAFDLYQSYGFPIEVTEELALERSLTVDRPLFDKLKKDFLEYDGDLEFLSKFEFLAISRINNDGTVYFDVVDPEPNFTNAPVNNRPPEEEQNLEI
jgi:hypothetical protein